MRGPKVSALFGERLRCGFFDYVDREVPVLMCMFEKRLRIYRAIGYAWDEAPLGDVEGIDEPTVEYDEEALRHFEEAT